MIENILELTGIITANVCSLFCLVLIIQIYSKASDAHNTIMKGFDEMMKNNKSTTGYLRDLNEKY